MDKAKQYHRYYVREAQFSTFDQTLNVWFGSITKMNIQKTDKWAGVRLEGGKAEICT